MCWVIRQENKKYEVGYYIIDSFGKYEWYCYRVYHVQEMAEDMCNYLNGGAN